MLCKLEPDSKLVVVSFEPRLMFSRSCEYAFQAVVYIALHSTEGRLIGLKEIADEQGSPPAFLSKILQKLVKGNILSSTKGPTGGYKLNDSGADVTLFSIVVVIDGMNVFERCGIGLDHCSDRVPCPIHNEYKEIKNRLRTLAQSKSVGQLALDVKKGKFTLSSLLSQNNNRLP